MWDLFFHLSHFLSCVTNSSSVNDAYAAQHKIIIQHVKVTELLVTSPASLQLDLYGSVQKPKELWPGFTDADWSPCTDWDSCDYRESEQIQITRVILSCSPFNMLCVGKCVLLESLDYLKMAQRVTSSSAMTSLTASVKDTTGLLLSVHHLKSKHDADVFRYSSCHWASLTNHFHFTWSQFMKDRNHHYNHIVKWQKSHTWSSAEQFQLVDVRLISTHVVAVANTLAKSRLLTHPADAGQR